MLCNNCGFQFRSEKQLINLYVQSLVMDYKCCSLTCLADLAQKLKDREADAPPAAEERG
jgi:hypothetical protein